MLVINTYTTYKEEKNVLMTNPIHTISCYVVLNKENMMKTDKDKEVFFFKHTTACNIIMHPWWRIVISAQAP